MHPRLYALALIQYLVDHPRAEGAIAVEKLVRVLEHRGHIGLLPRILSEYTKESERRERASSVTVAVADEKSRAGALAKAAVIAGERGVDQKNIRTVVDPDLLRGFALRGPGFRYDASARSQLQALYKQLITTN